jgi:hypothetical protein
MPGNNVTSECLQQRMRERQILARSKLRWLAFQCPVWSEFVMRPEGQVLADSGPYANGKWRPIPVVQICAKQTFL